MTCTSPRTIWFKQPRKIDGNFVRTFPADCGKCLNCLKKRKSHWAYRMNAEMQEAFSAYFVTLTYDDKHLPITGSHNYDDHKEFLSKLKHHEKPSQLKVRSHWSLEELERKKNEVRINRHAQKLKYYGVCEYGGQTGRTHWHYILFNIVDTASINNSWSHGLVHIDECNINTIDYTLKYMLKNEEERSDDREPNKSFMSKGIGEAAADAAFLNHISKIDNNTLGTARGSVIGIPRYYRKKYLTDDQRKAKGSSVAAHLEKSKSEKDAEITRLGGNPALRDVTKAHLNQRQLNEQKKRKL